MPLLGRYAICFVLTIIAVAVSGCTSRTHYPLTAAELPTHAKKNLLPEYNYRKQIRFPAAISNGSTENFWIKTLTLRSSGENGQVDNLVSARYFQSKKPGRKPLVIILPIWGLHTMPSDALANEIIETGAGTVNVLLVHGKQMLFDMGRVAYSETPELFVAHLHQMADRVISTIIDVRRLVDWAETRPEIESNKIALAGFSLSAMVASIALASEPRLGAGVLVMGGSNPQEAFATCGGLAGRMRNMIRRRFKWSEEKFRSSLKIPLARIDPARFAGQVDPRRVLIVEAGEDSCLSRSSRERFWEAMGRPERIIYQYDHRTTFMAMTFLGGGNLQKEAFRFLKKVFRLNPGV